MFPWQLPNRARFAIFVAVTALSLAGGLFLHGLSLAAAYLAVLPAFACYALVVRPHMARRLRYYHVLYVVLLTALVAGYLMVSARAVPPLCVRWMEVPVAVWFLLTMHVVVWLVDRAFSAALSTIPALRPSHGGASLQTVLRLLVLLFVAGPYIVALFSVHWVKFADNTDPQREYSLSFEHVRFPSADGVGLDGWFMPVSPSPSDTTVIVVPGRGMPKGCSLNYAQMFGIAGCNVLLFDLRGEGGSTGHSRSFGVREAGDVLGAVQYLQQRQAEASRHIYAFGLAQGASAVIRAAARDTRIRAIAVDSTLTLAQDLLPARVLRSLPGPLRTYVRAMTCAFASAELGCNLFRQTNLGEDLARLSPRPLLVIHGDRDAVADPQEATALYEAAGHPKSLDLVPGAGHGQALYREGTPYLVRILQMFALAHKMDLAS